LMKAGANAEVVDKWGHTPISLLAIIEYVD